MIDSDALRRSLLGIPGNESTLVKDGISSNPDEIFLDLEDSLAPGEKAAARDDLKRIVRAFDWTGTRLSYRINGTDTRWWYDDVIEIVGSVGETIDSLIVPKVRNATELQTVVTLLDSVEANADSDVGELGLSAQIETAEGMNNVIDIVDASDRLDAVIFGPADYAASIGAAHGAAAYPGHYWHYPLSRIAHAAASVDLLAIGGPYADSNDIEGFREACGLEHYLGYEGKVVIHPEQVDAANEIFSPNPDDAQRARRIVDAYENAESDATATIDGNVIDREMYQMARRILAKSQKVDLV